MKRPINAASILFASAISDLVVTTRYGASTYLKTYAGHLHSWHENPESYRRELRAFLARLLGP